MATATKMGAKSAAAASPVVVGVPARTPARAVTGEDIVAAVIGVCNDEVRRRFDAGEAASAQWEVVDAGLVRTRCRRASVVRARRLIALLCRERAGMSFPEINFVIRGKLTGHSAAVGTVNDARTLVVDGDLVFMRLLKAAGERLDAVGGGA